MRTRKTIYIININEDINKQYKNNEAETSYQETSDEIATDDSKL